MIKHHPDTKSIFRILKGGKISLVVSAVLVSTSLTIDANATDWYTVDDNNISNGIEYFSPQLGMNGNDTAIVNHFLSSGSNGVIYVDHDDFNGSILINSTGVLSATVSDGIYLYTNLATGGSITNSGTIEANRVGIYFYTNYGYGNRGTIENNGTITASTGIEMEFNDGNIRNTVNGNISSTSAYSARSIDITSTNNGTITNEGNITSTSTYTGTGYDATGIYLYNENNGTILNDTNANITATATGGAKARGIYVGSDGNTADGNITNRGTIDVYSESYQAMGIVVQGVNNGIIANDGDGNITVENNATNGAVYGGILVNNDNNGTIFNNTNASIAVTSQHSDALGGIVVWGDNLADGNITNNGLINATSNGGGSYGINLNTGDNDGTITNNGVIVSNTTVNGSARGIYVSGYNNGTILNDTDGNITVTSYGSAYGIDVATNDGNITNLGTMNISGSSAYGIYVGGENNGTIDNNGTITISESYESEFVAGISVGDNRDSGIIRNNTNGEIIIDAEGHGIVAGISEGTLNDDNVGLIENAGLIDINTTDVKYSIGIASYINAGTIRNTSDGNITVHSTVTGDNFDFTSAIGILTDINGGTIENNGSIEVYGDFGQGLVYSNFAVGIQTFNNTNVISNQENGTISAYGNVAVGILNSESIFSEDQNISGANTGTISNAGNINTYGFGSVGIFSIENNNTIENNATGIITSIGFASEGIAAFTNNGTIRNAGAIHMYGTIGFGILTYENNGTITNSGTISTDGMPELNILSSYSAGIKYMGGDGNITNTGTITARADGDANTYAFSIFGENGNNTIYNTYVDETHQGILDGNIIANGTLVNAGTIILPWNANSKYISASVRNFTHKDGATLTISVNNSGDYENNVTNHYSQLETDTAVIEDGAIIHVNVTETNSTGIAGQRMVDVISSTSLDINPSEVSVTDNSDVLDFSIIVDSNSINDDTTLDLQISGGAEATNYRQTKTVEANKHIFNLMHNIVELRQRQTGQESGTNGGDLMTKDEQFWFKPFYSTGSQNDKGSQNGFDFTTRGFGVGYDAEIFGKSRAGLALFYTLADIESNNVADKTDITNYTALLYGSMPLESGNTFMYQFAYGTQNNEGLRYIFEDDLTKYSSSDYDSTFTAVDLKWMGEYAFSNDMTAKPLVAASYRSFKTPSYQETGHNTDAALIVESSTVNQFILSAGEIFEYKVDNQTNFITDVRVGYDFNHGDNEVTASFEANSELIRTNGIDNGGIVYNLGFSYETDKEDSTFNLNYNLEGEGTDFQNHIFSAKYVFKF